MENFGLLITSSSSLELMVVDEKKNDMYLFI